jgi:ABC-type phosphate transport system substrate-binding protein
MRLCDALRLGSGVVAGVSGLLGAGATVIAQAAPSGGQLGDIATSLGTGSVLVGGSGVLIAISTLLKPYWEDRQKNREFEERKLKISTSLRRNNVITRNMYDWIVQARKQNPSLPPPPEWIAIPDVEDGPGL